MRPSDDDRYAHVSIVSWWAETELHLTAQPVRLARDAHVPKHNGAGTPDNDRMRARRELLRD